MNRSNSSILAAAGFAQAIPQAANTTPLRASQMSDAFANVRADKHSIPVRQGRRSLMARLYERRAYGEFRSSFVSPDAVFVFDADGTCVDLSGKRDVSLHAVEFVQASQRPAA